MPQPHHRSPSLSQRMPSGAPGPAAMGLRMLERVSPLAKLDGLRKMLTAPVSSSHFRIRLLGMSLHNKKRPSPNHTGPSPQRRPVASRSMAESFSQYFSKRGSTA